MIKKKKFSILSVFFIGPGKLLNKHKVLLINNNKNLARGHK